MQALGSVHTQSGLILVKLQLVMSKILWLSFLHLPHMSPELSLSVSLLCTCYTAYLSTFLHSVLQECDDLTLSVAKKATAMACMQAYG